MSSSADTEQKLSGNPAYILEYDDNVLTTLDDTVETRYLEVGTKIGNDYYFAVYFAEKGDNYEESLPIAIKIIESIKIGNPGTSPLPSQPQQQPQQSQPQPQQPLQPLQQQPQIIIPKSNTPPTAMNSSVVTTQNKPINIPLEIHDKEGNFVDISILQSPQFGT